MLETLTHGTLLGSRDALTASRARADLLIRPDGADAGIFEFHQIDALRDSGRRAAVEALEGAPDEIFG